MIDLLLTIIVLAIIGGLIYAILVRLAVPDPFKWIIEVAFLLICLLVLLGVVFGGVDLPALHIRR